MDEISVLFKEYDTLRQEILVAMQARNSTLTFGLATIGALTTASVTIYATNPRLSGGILTVVVPVICFFVLFMWLGEYQRVQRAGKFLVGLESRINDEAKKQLLTWETSLRNRRSSQHMKYPYYSAALLLTGLSCAAFSIGTVILIKTALVTIPVVAAGISCHVLVYRYVLMEMANLRS